MSILEELARPVPAIVAEHAPSRHALAAAARAIKDGALDASRGQWKIGDAVLSVLPAGERGTHTGSSEVLEQLAERTHLSAESLRGYRRVAAAFPDGRRGPSVSFSVHKDLASQEDRFELLAVLEAEAATGIPITRERARAIARRVPPDPILRIITAELTSLGHTNDALASAGPVLPETKARLVEDGNRLFDAALACKECIEAIEVIGEGNLEASRVAAARA